jgi:hypothetical protein
MLPHQISRTVESKNNYISLQCLNGLGLNLRVFSQLITVVTQKC